MKNSSTDFGFIRQFSEDEKVGIIEREEDGKLYSFDLSLEGDIYGVLGEVEEGVNVQFEPEKPIDEDKIPKASIVFVNPKSEDLHSK